VIKAESTPVSEVQKCLANLQQCHAPVFGVVLNQVDLSKARKQGYSHSDTFQNYDYLPR
jgi:Mrp family chromosome partitioning ATPase